jgi:uncharacterized protein YjbI with pentapeptide repeats
MARQIFPILVFFITNIFYAQISPLDKNTKMTLDLTRQKTYDHEIEVENVNLYIPIDYDIVENPGSVFKKWVSIQSSKITNPDFINSTFEDQFSVTNSDLFGQELFGQISFKECAFNSYANFRDSQFFSEAYFENTRFKEYADFSFAKFDKSADFSFTKFDADVNFDDCAFLNRGVDFFSTTFHNKLSLQHLAPESSIYFDQAELPDTIDLSHNYFKYDLDLTTASFKKNKIHYIRLEDVDVSKIHFDYFHFKLLMVGEFGDPLDNEKANYIYESILKNFKEKGQMNSYELLDVEYKKFRDRSYLKWQSHLNEIWWNFGYDKTKVIFNSFALLMFFSIINMLIFSKMKEGYIIEEIDKATERLNNKFISKKRKFLLRYFYCFYFTNHLFWRIRLDIENIKLTNAFIALWILFQYLIGLVCLAFIANMIVGKS